MSIAGVYLKIESADDDVFEVPGQHMFKMKNQGNIIDLLVAAHRTFAR